MSTRKEYTDRTEWRNEKGKLHRLDGPSVRYINGDKSWFKNGEKHREDGPAIEYKNGTNYWYLNGKLHRDNGPAVEWSDGYKEWWVNGIEYSEQEYKKHLIVVRLKRINNL